MLEMGSGLADIAGAPHATGADALSDGFLDSRPYGVQLSELLGLLALAPGQEGLVLGLWPNGDGPARWLGARAQRAAGTRPAIHVGELDLDDMVLELVDRWGP